MYVRSGGGVVADSVPSHEYEETVHKAQSMTEAIIKHRRLRDMIY